MKHPEYQYLKLMKDIMDNGSDKKLFFTPEVLQQYKDTTPNNPQYSILRPLSVLFSAGRSGLI